MVENRRNKHEVTFPLQDAARNRRLAVSYTVGTLYGNVG
jgi:hypothetical protein